MDYIIHTSKPNVHMVVVTYTDATHSPSLDLSSSKLWYVPQQLWRASALTLSSSQAWSAPQSHRKTGSLEACEGIVAENLSFRTIT